MYYKSYFRYILYFCLLINIGLNANADELATTFMLLNNYDLPSYSNIWQRMRNGFKLSHKETTRVKYYEKLYTKNPATIKQLINNAQPYLYYILTQTEKNGMPSEIALIPAVESFFNPLAKNPTDAYAGMWQFVPSTGRQFNLQQNNDFDDRQNVVMSTKAAINYLNYLYTMFNQWDVAIGAYNWGEGNMYRAIVASNQKIGKVEYSDLPLREITANYVPKIVAFANIIDNPSKFGISLDTVDNQPYFALTSITYPISIKNLSKVANIDNQTFAQLNPQFKNKSYKLQARQKIALPLKNQNIYFASANPNSNNNTNLNNLGVNQNNIVQVSQNAITTAPENNSTEQPDALMDIVYSKTESMDSTDAKTDTTNTQIYEGVGNNLNNKNEDKLISQINNTEDNENNLGGAKLTTNENKKSGSTLIMEKKLADSKKIENNSNLVKSSVNQESQSLDNLINDLSQRN